MTYEEGCKIAEQIVETGNKEIVGRDVTKHTKPGEGFVITKYNGTFQSVGMDDGLMFYLNHKARVCEVKAQPNKAADTPEAEAAPVVEEAPAPAVTESTPAAAAPQPTTETTAPKTQPVHTSPVTTPKEASMADIASGNSSIATEYVEETSQLATSLNAFISKLDSDRNVSEQAMRNFIDNPLDSTTISYHAARLSYTKEMLERLRGVAAALML
jgi:hypothetical protein